MQQGDKWRKPAVAAVEDSYEVGLAAPTAAVGGVIVEGLMQPSTSLRFWDVLLFQVSKKHLL